VMSYNDPVSGHHWRVYEVVNCNDVALLGPLATPDQLARCPSLPRASSATGAASGGGG